jgi:hypothetical protein
MKICDFSKRGDQNKIPPNHQLMHPLFIRMWRGLGLRMDVLILASSIEISKSYASKAVPSATTYVSKGIFDMFNPGLVDEKWYIPTTYVQRNVTNKYV